MVVPEFLLRHANVILFYAALILLIYSFRSKLDWQSKFVGLYRTKIGLGLMDRLGKEEECTRVRIGRFLLSAAFPVVVASLLLTLIHLVGFVTLSDGFAALLLRLLIISSLLYFVALALRPIKLAGIHGVIIGFAGMLFIISILGKGVYDLLFVPEAPPVISPVLPGITIPGVGIRVPLIIGWLALFIVILIHEFSHGVVARAHKIPIKSSGLAIFGPLGGAFVEPDEKVLEKRPVLTKLSVFAAGPFSNLVSSLAIFLLLSLVLAPIIFGFVASDGVVFDRLAPGMPAEAAGVATGVVYDRVGNRTIGTPNDFYTALDGLSPGDEVALSSSETGSQAIVTATGNPRNESQGYLGVYLGTNLKQPELRWLFLLLSKLFELLTWTYILGLGIGLANLLPIGPVDGGGMVRLAAERWFGEKRGRMVWAKISILILIVVLILLFVPLVIKPLYGLIVQYLSHAF